MLMNWKPESSTKLGRLVMFASMVIDELKSKGVQWWPGITLMILNSSANDG
jgi:hypothetical protein